MPRPLDGRADDDHIFSMDLFRATLLGLALLLVTVPVHAGDRDVVTPYRFTGPTKELTPLDQQRALTYQNQLQNQLRELDNADARGQLGPVQRRELLDTRREAGRMNGVLAPQQSDGLGITGSQPLPSLSGRIPLLSP